MNKSLFRKCICIMICIAMIFGPVCPPVGVHADTTITEVSVTDITAPYIGEKPDYTASVSADVPYYIGDDIGGMSNDVNGLAWVKYNADSTTTAVQQTAAFESDVVYEVRLELYAKSGASFAEKNDITVLVNGQKGRVISREADASKIFIGYTIGAPKPERTLVTSIELYHENEIEAKNAVSNLKVSKINGQKFDGEAYAEFQWYFSWDNFDDINTTDVDPWNGSVFEGGYAYGLRINTLPDIDGYKYNTLSIAVTIKTPSRGVTSEGDLSQGIYFYWNKLAHKPDLEAVNITMDGYYVDENIMDLTFTSEEAIKTDGGYGLNKRYTIKQYNAGTGDYDTLSNTVFVANKKYYLFYYLESDLSLQGLNISNVKLNGIAASSKGVESSGKTYYMFSLDKLTEQDILKTPVASIVVSLPKAQPIAGDDLYVPTIVSVNGDANLASAVKKVDATWYQNDFHIPEQGDYGQADSKFVQGKSYCLRMNLKLAEGYKLADDYFLIVQTPAGILEGVLDSQGESYVTYEYYFNLGAPTELPMLTSYTVELSGYQAGAKIEDTALNMTMNGLSLPKEMLVYGMGYTIVDQNQQPIKTGTFDYGTQYYLGTIVAPYNCKLDGLTEVQIKNLASLNGIHPETAIAMQMGGKLLGWQIYFKLPVLKQGTSCNGLEHDYASDMIPATFDTDGKTYKKCKGCGAEGDAQPIAKVSTVQLSQTTYTFDGQNKQPSVVVKDAAGKMLVQDKDYSLVYSSESKAVGTYIVKVILKGSYSGTKDFTYKITTPHIHAYKEQIVKKATATANGKIQMKCSCGVVKSTTTIAKVSKAKLSVSSYLYNGKKKAAPKVIVKDSKGKTISTKYYTVKKPKSTLKNIGKYTYTIQFKGTKYSGTKKLTLTIKPGKTSITKAAGTKKAVNVKWKEGKKAQVTGYQVMVATNSKFTKNVKTKKIKGYSKTSYKMTKLKAKTKYYVKVRAYKVTKTGTVYGPWSAVKTAKTK